ncbi:hypothetical protein A1D29_01410 [Pasteurellaceae bacterium Orientalotternb1]|nr:hypothetical protein A1D29_01410 [Pasteurellaceae bacterium Orientalotternb1]
MIAESQFIVPHIDDKSLRQQLKTFSVDARRLSRFSQLALLGALPLKSQITPNTPIYLGSSFASPSKFNKMFSQLIEQDLPSPLDFMANLNNAATFQLAQALQTQGTTLFVAIDEQTLSQPLQLALLDLADNTAEAALVGWAFESPDESSPSGSLWVLLECAKNIANTENDM